MGAVQILTHSMVQSIEENSVRKGYDPRDFALVAEGGAGPLFAAQIALEVGTPTVVVPPTRASRPRWACWRRTWSTSTWPRCTSGSRGSTTAALQRRFEELEALAAGQLAEDGIDPGNVQIQRIAECRYLGQGYELRVDTPSGVIDGAWAEKVRADFHDIHERILAPLRGVGHRSRTSASAGSGSHPRCGRRRSSRAPTRRTRRCGTREAPGSG